MKKRYEKPEIEVIEFIIENAILAASDELRLCGELDNEDDWD